MHDNTFWWLCIFISHIWRDHVWKHFGWSAASMSVSAYVQSIVYIFCHSIHITLIAEKKTKLQSLFHLLLVCWCYSRHYAITRKPIGVPISCELFTKKILPFFVFSSNTFIRGFPDSIMNQPIIRMENRLAVFFTIHILSIQFRICFGTYQYWMSEPRLPKYILYHACIDSEAGFANGIFLFWLIRFGDAFA